MLSLLGCDVGCEVRRGMVVPEVCCSANVEDTGAELRGGGGGGVLGGGAIDGSCVVWTALLLLAILSSVVVEPVRTLGDGRLGMF